jgi:hypothetical protein
VVLVAVRDDVIKPELASLSVRSDDEDVVEENKDAAAAGQRDPRERTIISGENSTVREAKIFRKPPLVSTENQRPSERLANAWR